MEEDYGINLKLPLSMIETILVALEPLPYADVAAIIESVTIQTQVQMDQNAAFNELFEDAKRPDFDLILEALGAKRAHLEKKLAEAEYCRDREAIECIASDLRSIDLEVAHIKLDQLEQRRGADQ